MYLTYSGQFSEYRTPLPGLWSYFPGLLRERPSTQIRDWYMTYSGQLSHSTTPLPGQWSCFPWSSVIYSVLTVMWLIVTVLGRFSRTLSTKVALSSQDHEHPTVLGELSWSYINTNVTTFCTWQIAVGLLVVVLERFRSFKSCVLH